METRYEEHHLQAYSMAEIKYPPKLTLAFLDKTALLPNRRIREYLWLLESQSALHKLDNWAVVDTNMSVEWAEGSP